MDENVMFLYENMLYFVKDNLMDIWSDLMMG